MLTEQFCAPQQATKCASLDQLPVGNGRAGLESSGVQGGGGEGAAAPVRERPQSPAPGTSAWGHRALCSRQIQDVGGQTDGRKYCEEEATGHRELGSQILPRLLGQVILPQSRTEIPQGRGPSSPPDPKFPEFFLFHEIMAFPPSAKFHMF